MSFPYEALEKAGLTSVRVSYSGEGDEGSIEEIEGHFVGDIDAAIPDELIEEIEEMVYGLLAERFGGWEINEGSQGTLSIDVAERKAVLRHGVNEIRTTYETVEV